MGVASRVRQDIVTAYPEFKQYAESGGDTNQTWYQSPADNQRYEP